MVADQQAELAEELARAEALGDEVVAEVEVDRALRDDVHRGAEVAAAEQLFAGFDPARPPDLREQRVLLRGQRRGGFEHCDVGVRGLARRRLAIHSTTPRRARIAVEDTIGTGSSLRYGSERGIRPPCTARAPQRAFAGSR